MSLTDDIQQRQSSLLDDVLKTAKATALTAGAAAVKGLSLGLLDFGPYVEEELGEEVYRAAPQWARTGAEIAGGFVPVSLALRGARAAIPGVGMVPRVLQGFAAGAGLGAVHGAIAGEPMEELVKGSLLEGAIFGGIEGLTGIPALLKKRKLKDLQQLWRGIDRVPNPATEVTAEAIADSAIQTTGRAAEEAVLPQATKLSDQFIKDPDILLYFKMVDEPLTLQRGAEVRTGKIHDIDAKHLQMAWEDGAIETFPLKDFRVRRGAQKLRLFRGTTETHSFPENAAYEMLKTRGQVRLLRKRMWEKGMISKTDYDKLLKVVNPRASRLKHLSEHELHTYSSYLTKMTTGEKLPDVVMEQIRWYGAANTDVRMGIHSTLRPARWMFEGLAKRVPWIMDRWYNPALRAFANRSKHQFELLERAEQIFKGTTKKDRLRMFKIDEQMAKKIKAVPGSPEYLSQRKALLDQHYGAGAKELRLRQAHEQIREFYDSMFKELVDKNLIEAGRYTKEYWPLLREESILKAMFSAKGQHISPAVPKHVKGFMQHIRKGLIEHPETDIMKLTRAYVNVFTKLLHVKPEVEHMFKLFKDFKVPKHIRKYMEHYMARQMGIPSQADLMTASSFKSMAQFLPWVGKHIKRMPDGDVLRWGMMFNNLPYYAHMGLRPFAAARNLLQPFITTGPMIGNQWLLRGYGQTFKKGNSKWLAEIGAISDELMEYKRLGGMGGSKKLDSFGNALMKMFVSADRVNRVASGAGMAAKFDHYFKKLGMTEKFLTKMKVRRFRDSVRTDIRNKMKVYRALDDLEKFKYHPNSPAYKRNQKIIEEFTPRNVTYETAADVVKDVRNTFAKEAIGDTQWLYGKANAPLFSYLGGPLGRQAMTYQSWWLNYTEWMVNLVKVTKAGDFAPLMTAFANNMLIFMALSAAGYEANKIFRTIAFGPFTGKTLIEGELPPAMDPFVKGLGGVKDALIGDFEGAEKRFNTAVDKAWQNWVPGSLVYREWTGAGPYATEAERLWRVMGRK